MQFTLFLFYKMERGEAPSVRGMSSQTLPIWLGVCRIELASLQKHLQASSQDYLEVWGSFLVKKCGRAGFLFL